MSNLFTLDHVIQECLQEKSGTLTTARGKTPGAKMDIYANSWVALNAWIESRLCKSKSASISGFGTFGWELLERNGETHCRPIFMISDNFVKIFRVKKQRVHRLPTMTPSEEINYSLLAIKYSKNLTKDMVFTGLRDILKKIGDIVYRGSEIEIEFTIGTFIAKENRTKFIFNQTRLMDILPENLGTGVFAHDDGPLPYVDGDADGEEGDNTTPFVSKQHYKSSHSLPRIPTATPRSSRSTASSRVPSLDFTRTNNNTNTATSSSSANIFQNFGNSVAFADDDEGIAFGDTSSPPPFSPAVANAPESLSNSSFAFPAASSTTKDSAVNATMTNIGSIKILEEKIPNRSTDFTENNPSELRKLLDAIANQAKSTNKIETRNRAKAAVITQAFERCLQNVEVDAQDNEAYRHEQMRLHDDWQSKLAKKKRQQHQLSQELNTSLHAQVEDFHSRLHGEKSELKNSLVQCILPEGPDPVTERERKKTIHAKQLNDQISSHQKQLEDEKRTRLLKEQSFLNQIAAENDLQLLISRSEHLERQKELLTSWEQDGHIRNLKKLQSLGTNPIHDYIDRNLLDSRGGLLSASGTGMNGSQSLGKSLMKSIGYDPRTGKS